MKCLIFEKSYKNAKNVPKGITSMYYLLGKNAVDVGRKKGNIISRTALLLFTENFIETKESGMNELEQKSF